LIEPKLVYDIDDQLIEVGTSALSPNLEFTQNDAGAATNTEQVITYKGSTVSYLENYANIGTYTYTGTVTYDAGEYLINNKGETTTRRVEAGSISTTVDITATYPWYAGSVGNLTKQKLIPFD